MSFQVPKLAHIVYHTRQSRMPKWGGRAVRAVFLVLFFLAARLAEMHAFMLKERPFLNGRPSLAFPMWQLPWAGPFYAIWTDEELLILAFDAWREIWMEARTNAYVASERYRRGMPPQLPGALPCPCPKCQPLPQGMQPAPLAIQDQPEPVSIQAAPLPPMSSSDPYVIPPMPTRPVPDPYVIPPMPTRPVPITLDDMRTWPRLTAAAGTGVGPRPRRRRHTQIPDADGSWPQLDQQLD